MAPTSPDVVQMWVLTFWHRSLHPLLAEEVVVEVSAALRRPWRHGAVPGAKPSHHAGGALAQPGALRGHSRWGREPGRGGIGGPRGASCCSLSLAASGGLASGRKGGGRGRRKKRKVEEEEEKEEKEEEEEG